MSAKDCEGHFTNGWIGFYQDKVDLDQGKPQLRTYKGAQAEKFYETFKQPHVAPRPGKQSVIAPRTESYTWGMGGTLPCGKMYLPVPPAGDFKLSQKMYLVPRESDELAHGMDMGRKAHVYDAAGVDRKSWRSEAYTIENQLQREAKVPEELRTDSRTIHRMAPPGLKGYMGAEYSNDFFATRRIAEGGTHPHRIMMGKGGTWPIEERVSLQMVERPMRKTFAQKRSEEEIAEQVALVDRLLLEGDGLDSEEEDYAGAEQAPAAAGE